MSDSCYVKNLASNGGNLPIAAGLSVSSGALRWDPGILGCCDGQGYRLSRPNELQRCDLRPRLATLAQLQRRCIAASSAVGADNLDFKAMQLPLARDLYRGLRRIIEPKTHLPSAKSLAVGQIYHELPTRNPSTKDLGNPHRLVLGQSWLLAFTAAWHFGLKPHVVTIGTTKAQDLLPKDRESPGQLMIINGLAKLWQADHLHDFELVVSYAYNSALTLWLGLEEAPSGPPLQAETVAKIAKRSPSPFDQRLNTLRSRSPLGWIPRSLLSKCQSICAGPWPRELSRGPPSLERQGGSQYPDTYGSRRGGIPKDV